MDMLSNISNKYNFATKAQQKQFGLLQSRTEHYIKFGKTIMGLDPKLSRYSKSMQTAIAVIYCDYIAKGHTIYGL